MTAEDPEDRPGAAGRDRDARPATTDASAGSDLTAAERRRRRARVFGDVLPDGTRDERGDAWGDEASGDRSEEWLRGQVPPHHG